MKSDLKHRLINCGVGIAVLVVSSLSAWAEQLPADSVRQVSIRVVAKEKVANFDSIFHAIPVEDDRPYITALERITPGSKIAGTSGNDRVWGVGSSYSTAPAKKQEHLSSKPDSLFQTDTLKSDNSLDTGPVQDLFSEKSLPATIVIPQVPQGHKISYLWIGFVLVIGGIVLGLIFGRAAFLVSAIGIVFLIIGFYLGQ